MRKRSSADVALGTIDPRSTYACRPRASRRPNGLMAEWIPYGCMRIRVLLSVEPRLFESPLGRRAHAELQCQTARDVQNTAANGSQREVSTTAQAVVWLSRVHIRPYVGTATSSRCEGTCGGWITVASATSWRVSLPIYHRDSREAAPATERATSALQHRHCRVRPPALRRQNHLGSRPSRCN